MQSILGREGTHSYKYGRLFFFLPYFLRPILYYLVRSVFTPKQGTITKQTHTTKHPPMASKIPGASTTDDFPTKQPSQVADVSQSLQSPGRDKSHNSQ